MNETAIDIFEIIWVSFGIFETNWVFVEICWDSLRVIESVSYLLRGFTTKWILHAILILWDVFGCRLQQRIQNLGLTIPEIIRKSLNDIFELFCQNLRSDRRTNSRGKNLMILCEIRNIMKYIMNTWTIVLNYCSIPNSEPTNQVYFYSSGSAPYFATCSDLICLGYNTWKSIAIYQCPALCRVRHDTWSEEVRHATE